MIISYHVLKNIAHIICSNYIFSFFWVAASSVFATEAQDDGDNRWWDIDLTKEEEAALKIVLCLLVLVIACGTLAKPLLKVWHPSKGSFGRFELGVLAASLFRATSSALCHWYSRDSSLCLIAAARTTSSGFMSDGSSWVLQRTSCRSK